MQKIQKHRLAFITLMYWFLLIYIVAALVWWFISLEKQNNEMFQIKRAAVYAASGSYDSDIQNLVAEKDGKHAQYIGEGSIFFLLIILGAVFVYRATRKQLRVSQQQHNFMMAVTHELKTPIAITKLNLETLQKRKLEPEQQEKLISLALDETNRLSVLTNNILVAAQLESGNYTISSQEVDLGAVTENCVSDFRRRFPQRIITTSIEEGAIVSGEAILLQMLINNLIDNAIKYASSGTDLRVEVVKKESSAVLKIIDNGPGIPDAEKARVFEKFYRSGDENTRTAKGTGLGLYLCKKITEDHKGKIAVKDNTPHGAIFIVSLPLIL